MYRGNVWMYRGNVWMYRGNGNFGSAPRLWRQDLETSSRALNVSIGPVLGVGPKFENFGPGPVGYTC